MQEFLAASLKSYGMNAVLLASLGELSETLATVPVCGILLELASALAAPAKDKKATRELLEFYPSAKFRFANQQVLMLGETLDQFLSRCRQFEPRITRRSVRNTAHTAVFLSADESFSNAERAVTVNVSQKGYFVYSAREWGLGHRAWLKFPDHEATIGGIVRSYQPWGSSKSFPGIGIETDANVAAWSITYPLKGLGL
jgi:hypothetical protein